MDPREQLWFYRGFFLNETHDLLAPNVVYSPAHKNDCLVPQRGVHPLSVSGVKH